MAAAGGISDEESSPCSPPSPSSSVASRGAYSSLKRQQPRSLALALEEATGRQGVRCLAAPGRWLLAGGLLAACLVALAVRRLPAAAAPSRAEPRGAEGVEREDAVTLVAGLQGCVGRGENCLDSGCCKEPGMACYKKHEGWAMCRPQCTPGPDPLDPTPTPWLCDKIGAHTPGAVSRDYLGGLKPAGWVAKTCSADGENCMQSRCCKDNGMTCYAKNAKWASCKPSCVPGFDITDITPEPWKCTALGNPTPLAPPAAYTNSRRAAPWVAKKCSGPGESCLKTSCCKDPGMVCYRKNEGWAGCRASCVPGPNIYDVNHSPWDCAELGPRTPGIPPPRGPVGPWVATQCTGEGGNCASTGCCTGVNRQCYRKNYGWAACLHECSPGVQSNDPDKSPWSCEPLGPRNPGPITSPSLFCWALARPTGNEAELMRYQMRNHLSLFRCEDWTVFSDWAFDLGNGYSAKGIGDLTAQKGQWGSWLNTVVFAKAWHQIFWSGKFRDHDWTVKIDPDATFFPDRLKEHLAPLSPDHPWWIHNSRTSTPMLGPIEVISRGGMYVYYANNPPNKSGTWGAVCEDIWMDQSGEDGFISGCLKRLGVAAKYDAKILKQDREDCGDGVYVAYHPCKTVSTYELCHSQAVAAA